MVCILVVAGCNSTRIAAPLGLFGTIVGYLLGRPTAPARDSGTGTGTGGDGGAGFGKA